MARGDGQQRHEEACHRACIIAVVDVRRVFACYLGKQATKQTSVTRGRRFGDTETTACEVINHQPPIAHALGGRQRDTYVVSLH